jgi:hypothetical protein
MDPEAEFLAALADDDDRRDRVLARARAILDRKPSPAEIAEHKARRRHNRIAEIMTPRAPDLVRYKVQENAMQPTTEECARFKQQIADAEAKSARGERLDRADLVVLHADAGIKLRETLEPLVRGGDIMGALHVVLVQFAQASIVNRLARDDLEARISQLERAAPKAKPRLRVVAGSRQVP